MRNKKVLNAFIIVIALILTFVACDFIVRYEGSKSKASSSEQSKQVDQNILDNLGNLEDSKALEKALKSKIKFEHSYYDKKEVAAYIHFFNALPPNYISKEEARNMNWQASPDSKFVIGGSKFSNREGLLPKDKNRQYYECDLRENYTSHRGASRLVYSNDGLIFYTNDHYNSFKQLY